MKRLLLTGVLCSCFTLGFDGLAADPFANVQANTITVAMVDLSFLPELGNPFLPFDPYGPKRDTREALMILPDADHFAPPWLIGETIGSLRNLHANFIAVHGASWSVERMLMDQLQTQYPFSTWTRTDDGERVGFLSKRLFRLGAPTSDYWWHTSELDLLLGQRIVHLACARMNNRVGMEPPRIGNPPMRGSDPLVLMTSSLKRWSVVREFGNQDQGVEPALPRGATHSLEWPFLPDTPLTPERDLLHPTDERTLNFDPYPLPFAHCSFHYGSYWGCARSRCEICNRHEDIFHTEGLAQERFARAFVRVISEANGQRGCRPVPVATFSLKKNAPALPALDLPPPEAGGVDTENATKAPSRDGWVSSPVALPRP